MVQVAASAVQVWVFLFWVRMFMLVVDASPSEAVAMVVALAA